MPPEKSPQYPERVVARVGRWINQKYKISRVLGMGGTGVVYAGHRRNGLRVAIKYLLDKYADDADVLRLFAREAYLANDVGHPGAVAILDEDVDEDGNTYLVMPLLEGETLRQRWERHGKRLPLEEVCVWMHDALDVLAAAHAQLDPLFYQYHTPPTPNVMADFIQALDPAKLVLVETVRSAYTVQGCGETLTPRRPCRS